MKLFATMKQGATAAFAVAALSFAAPATAATLVGTFSTSIVGVNSSTPSIGVGTTFTNTLFSVVGSTTGDYAGLTGSFLTVSAMTATNGSPFSFTSAFGNFSGTISNVVAAGPIANRVVSFYALGNLTPLGSLSSFAVSPSSATFSFTQTGGADSAVSGSFTLASPPAGVPEPAAWAMMILGFGTAGFSLRRRKALALA